MLSPRSISENKSGLLPLVIGLTGHREFPDEDIPKLQQRIRQIFQNISEQYPSTPIILLTSLAEGADRLGAHIGLEMGMELIAPLPLEREVYETDFAGNKSKQEFDALLERARKWFELPLVEGATPEGVKTQGYERNLQYAEVGAYIARYSQILVALWDGIEYERLGGTSMVVSYKLKGIPELFGPPQSPLDPVETGPVYHIVVRRKNADNYHGKLFGIKKYFPRGWNSDAQAEDFFGKIYGSMDSFNEDILRHEKFILHGKKQSAEYLFPSQHEASLSDALRETRDYYTSADVLASFYQRYTHGTFLGIFTCVFFAAFFFDIYAHVFDERLVLTAYLTSLLVAFLWYKVAKKKQYQTKYLDYRSLAEGLRVQFFWEYAGITESPSDYYLRKQKSELDWIRYALRTIALPAAGDTVAQTHSAESRYERMNLILSHWVEDQAKYFPRAMKRDHRKLYKLELGINFFFALGLALAALQLSSEPQHFLVVAIGLAPFIAALLGGYIERNALLGHIKQYERMGELFHHAREWLEKLMTEGKRHEAQELLIELGKEALGENGDWMLLHRERPLEVPKG